MKTPFIFALTIVMFTSCYVHKWNTESASNKLALPHNEISSLFHRENDTIVVTAECPGYNYQYDIGEKGHQYNTKGSQYLFDRVEITLCDSMPKEIVLVNIEFSDSANNKFRFEQITHTRI